MRKLPFLFILLLLSLMLLAAAASAHALTLPSTTPVAPLTGSADNEEADEQGEEGESEAGDDEGEEAESDEGENCSAGDEAEEELCEEKAEEAEAEECLLEDAEASVVVSPGEAHLTIHYDAFEPTAVAIDARLHGGKGSLQLGSERAHFHQAGVFHDSFSLGGKQRAKALAARGFEVDLHAVGTPADCALHLANRVPHRAK